MSNLTRSNISLRAGLALLLVALIVSAGCAQTREAKPKREGFLSPSQWALMKPAAEDDDFELMYSNPDVDWNDYTGAMVESVSFWRSTAKQKLSAVSLASLLCLLSWLEIGKIPLLLGFPSFSAQMSTSKIHIYHR